MSDGQRFTHRHDTVGQAHLHCLIGTHRPTGQDQVHRSRVPDHPREPHGSAVDERHSPTPAEDTEDRVLFDDPQIGQQCQLQAAGDGIARDRGDEWFRQRHAAWAHRPGTVRVELRSPRLVGD